MLVTRLKTKLWKKEKPRIFIYHYSLTRITGNLHEDQCTFVIISRWILLGMRNVSDRRRENKNTHFVLNNFFPLKSCCLWDNVGKCGRVRQSTDENIIRHTRITYWIPRATDTYRIYNTYCFYTTTTVTRTHLNVTSYVHCLSYNFFAIVT